MPFRSFALIAVIAVGIAGCGANAPKQDNAETQPGNAADLNRGPRTGSAPADCSNLPDAKALRDLLLRAPTAEGEAGGLFSGHFEWAAVVNRKGELCAIQASTDDPSAAWPGSLAISESKAYTANAFSGDTAPLSTARVYTLTQPGHSLWGIASGNPFNPECMATPDHAAAGVGKICGGSIAFAGGLPLYRNKTRVGGLGVSGDTACTDHEIAKRMRHMAGLDPEKGEFADDIIFEPVDGPSIYAHPLCPNTWRNGKKLGDESSGHGS
jgi:uncharacterized protein GlcG (DUF336 family)